MRIVYFGSGEFAVPALRKLLNGPHELAMIVTQPDRPAGRGKQLTPTSVAARAAADGRDAVRCADVNDPAFIARVAQLRADLGVVVAFGQKLLEPLRRVMANGCINLHGSLLPRHRGASPISAAILAGDQITGVSSFRLVDRMDAGPVLVQRQTAISPDETTGELHDRLAGVACDCLTATLELLARDPSTPGAVQDEALKTYAPKLTKVDGRLCFSRPAQELVLRCRAMSPWPGARCRYVPAAGTPVDLTVVTAAAVPGTSAEPPGTITPVLTVATGEGSLELHSVQPAGKRPMSWQDFVNGRHVQPGDRLEQLSE